MLASSSTLANNTDRFSATELGRLMMSTNKEQFVDDSGNRTAMLLEVPRYLELLEAQEELESIRAYDDAKASNDEALPFAQAVKEIENT
jgi:hypothetical protein